MDRQQRGGRSLRAGLIVAKGNPRKITSLRDLTRRGIKLVDRQQGSGTRVLLDALLRNASIDPSRIHGYDSGEFTHAAVAAFVASGIADVGLGIEPAARQFKLDFYPVIKERYMLSCNIETLAQPAVTELINLLKGSEFARMIKPLAGYSPDSPGDVATFGDVFPWLASNRKPSSLR